MCAYDTVDAVLTPVLSMTMHFLNHSPRSSVAGFARRPKDCVKSTFRRDKTEMDITIVSGLGDFLLSNLSLSVSLSLRLILRERTDGWKGHLVARGR
jgi:hypothetical protein